MKQLFFKIIVSIGISLILVVPTSLAACLAAGNTQVAASHSPIVTNKKMVKKVIKKKKKKKAKKAKKVTPPGIDQGAENNIQGTSQGTSGATGSSTGATTGASAGASMEVPLPKTWQVSIASMAFAQSSLTVKKGDSVKFTNNDDVPHQVASDPHPIHTNLPVLNGALMNKGDMFEMKFDQAGTYTYHCHLHPNMRGTIVVTE